jgi:hypothetical protein
MTNHWTKTTQRREWLPPREPLVLISNSLSFNYSKIPLFVPLPASG